MIDAGTDASIQLLLAPPSKRGTNNSRKTSVTPVFYESLWHILYIGVYISILVIYVELLTCVMFMSW